MKFESEPNSAHDLREKSAWLQGDESSPEKEGRKVVRVRCRPTRGWSRQARLRLSCRSVGRQLLGDEMRILNIDLDFFLSDIRYSPQDRSRPPAKDFKPWPPEAVQDFMERNCGLDPTAPLPLPGILVQTHDEVFDIWKEQIRTGQLKTPFDVVHIDAHADLGLGDASYTYILGDLLHAPPSDRQDPKRGGSTGLHEGNYLAFAVACRWLRTITYVHHPARRNDLPRFLFRDHDPATKLMELACYRPEDARMLALLKTPPVPLSMEPVVPIDLVSKNDFRERDGFALGYVSVSPLYTPEEAEVLVPVIEGYVRLLDRNAFLKLGR